MAVAPPTRVAVVQLAYHPAALVDGRSPLTDPVFDLAAPTSSLAPRTDTPLPEAVEARLRDLGERVRRAHNDQIAGKAAAILAACRGWGVHLVVFPEYSLACELLPAIAAAAGDMIVVAGTHAVDRAALRGSVYRELACPEDQVPRLGEAVCPVIYRGRILALQAKMAADLERGSLVVGARWCPCDLPEETGVPGPLATLIGGDLRRAHEAAAAACALIAAPSHAEAPALAARLADAGRGRPIAVANLARAGGTTFVTDHADATAFPEGVAPLPAGDEGVIIVDVDLRGAAAALVPFAEASLVYRTHPHGDAFAAWIDTLHQAIDELADDDAEGLYALLDAVDERRQFLLDAGGIPGASARGRRYAELLERLGSIPTKDELARFTREVIVPSSILPFEHVREAMSLGAHEAIHGWWAESGGELGGMALMEVAHRLKEAGHALRAPPPEMWTEAGRRGIEAIKRAVAGERASKSAEGVDVDALRQALEREAADGGGGAERARARALDQAADLEGGGLRIHLRSHVDELRGDRRRGPGRADGERRDAATLWSARELDEIDELRLWLADEGVSELRIVAVTDPEGRRRACLYVLGRRSAGDLHLWRIAGADKGMSGRSVRLALTRLGVPVDGVDEIDLERARTRLTSLVDRLRDPVVAGLADRRAGKLADVDAHYEPPDVLIDGADASTPALAALDAWIDDDAAPPALLLGEFGAGKSSLLTVWAERRWRAGMTPLPALVPLQEASGDEAPAALLLRALGRDDDEPERARLALLLRHRRLVPCFDGVDEVATRIDESSLQARIRALSECTGPQGQVLIAARDHTFASEGELARALPGARRLALAPLSEAQVGRLIGAIRGADAETILRRLAGTYDLADLVRRPLLLGMVLRSLDELDPSARVGTADVYNAYIAHWLRASHVGAAEALSDDAKTIFAEELAAELWRSGAPTCPIKQLRASVLDVLRERLVGDATLDPVSVFYEIQTGAFFVREGDAFRFAHRSFLEFFLARGLVRHLDHEPGRRLTTRPLTREVILFVDQLLRREHGDPLASPPIQGVRAWLVRGAEPVDAGAIDPRINALRLLLHLPMLAHDAGASGPHDTRQWVPEGARLAGVRLPGEDLRHARLQGVDLRGAILCGADLRCAHLDGAQLAGCDLRATRLEGVDLARVELRGADLEYAEDDAATAAALVAPGGPIVAALPVLARPSPADAIDPEGRLVAVATGHALHVVVAEVMIRAAQCSFPAIRAAWSPEGRAIAAISAAAELIVWDPRTGRVELRVRLADADAYPELQRVWRRERHEYPLWYGMHGLPPFLVLTRIAWSAADAIVVTSHAAAISISATSGAIAAIEPFEPYRFGADAPDDRGTVGGAVIVRHSADILEISAASRSITELRLDLVEPARTSASRAAAAKIPTTDRGGSPDGRHVVVATEDDETLTIARSDGAAIASRHSSWPSLWAYTVAWSPAGRRVFLLEHDLPFSLGVETDGPTGRTILWWREGTDAIADFHRSDRPFTAIAALPDPWEAVVAGDVDGRVQRLERGGAIDLGQRPHAGRVTRIAVSVDGSRLATVDASSRLIVWDLEQGVEIARRAAASIVDLAWDPTSRRLATAHRDRSVRLWSREGGLLATFAFDDAGWLLHSAGGFLVLDDPNAHVLVGREVVDGDLTMIRWRPLGGLRHALHRPDRVAAALRGDLSGDDVRPALRAAGWLVDGRGDASALDEFAAGPRPRGSPELDRFLVDEAEDVAAAQDDAEDEAPRQLDLDRLLGPFDGFGVELPAAELAREEGPTRQDAAIDGDDGDLSFEAGTKDEDRDLSFETAADHEDRTIRPVEAIAGADAPDPASATKSEIAPVLAAEVAVAPITEVAERASASPVVAAREADDLGSSAPRAPPVRRAHPAPPNAAAPQPATTWHEPPEAAVPPPAPANAQPSPTTTPPSSSASATSPRSPPATSATTLAARDLDAPRGGASRPSTGAHAQGPHEPVPSDRSMRSPVGRGLDDDEPASPKDPPTSPNTGALGDLLRKLSPSRPALAEGQRRLREKRAERGPLAPNPFLPGRPLNDADALPGREDALAELQTLIDQRSPALLKGPRRAGKSSILYTLARIEGRRRPVYHRTLEGAAPKTPAEFACLIEPALKDSKDPADALLAALEGADAPPLLLLDEVAWLTRADESLFPWLRVLGQTGLCALVVAGTHSDWIDVIRVANRTPGSSFGNDYTIVELPALAEADAIAFLVDTAPADVEIDPDRGARWIVELCGGWPFYLQVMGYAVVEEARQGKRTALVDKGALFDLYERRLLRDRVAVFRSRWADLRPPAQGVMLRILAEGARTKAGPALPSYRDLARRERAILGDAGLIDGQRGWLLDAPFRDWLIRNFDELEDDDEGR